MGDNWLINWVKGQLDIVLPIDTNRQVLNFKRAKIVIEHNSSNNQ